MYIKDIIYSIIIIIIQWVTTEMSSTWNSKYIKRPLLDTRLWENIVIEWAV